MVSSWVVIGLLLASVAMFVGLIQRIGLLQINRMLKFTGDQGRAVIETVYPELDSAATGTRSEEFRTLPLTQTVLHHSGPEVIQKLDMVALVDLARVKGGVIASAITQNRPMSIT